MFELAQVVYVQIRVMVTAYSYDLRLAAYPRIVLLEISHVFINFG